MDRTVYDNVAIPLIAGASGDDIRRRVSALDKVGLLDKPKKFSIQRSPAVSNAW